MLRGFVASCEPNLKLETLNLKPSARPADFRMPTTFVETIPVSKWVAVMRRLTRSRPLHVTVDRSYGFRHPWHSRAQWHQTRWHLDVNPGYVNARETLARIDGDLVPLSTSPPLPVPPALLRPIGDDPEALGGERVPDYFRSLGVGSEEYEVSTDLAELSRRVALTGDFPDASTRRRLRACELVLAQPRAALRMEFGDEAGEPTLQLAISTPDDPSPVISLRRAWSGSPPQAGIEALLAGRPDNGLDEKHLATVYLLSPVGAAIDAVPDASWQCLVQHRTWWNLRHEVNQFLESVPDQRITLPGLGLAGGVGDALIAGAVLSTEATLNQARALLDRSRIEGRFWSV